MSDAKETYIEDVGGASQGLAAMAAHADVLKQQVETIVGKIVQHESGKPWGTAPEFGGAFEKQYHAGRGGTGSSFVKDNIKILAEEATEGVTVANEALHSSANLDQDIANAFTVAGSKDVATAMLDTGKPKQ